MSSGQGTSARLLKSSPNGAKQQGPMKATIPMSSLLKQSNVKKSDSPTSPDYWKSRMSPESCLRSPGSTIYKGTSFNLNITLP